ncbi:hypothetical protein NKH18_00940 [Streptomyces sp. M10(2022)]
MCTAPAGDRLSVPSSADAGVTVRSVDWVRPDGTFEAQALAQHAAFLTEPSPVELTPLADRPADGDAAMETVLRNCRAWGGSSWRRGQGCWRVPSTSTCPVRWARTARCCG